MSPVTSRRWPTLPRSSADEAPCPGSVHASVVCPQATHRHGECSGRSTRASVTWVCRATLTGERGVPDRAPGEAWVAAGTQGDRTRRPPGEQRCHLIFIREPRGGPGSRAALLGHHLPCSGRAPWGGAGLACTPRSGTAILLQAVAWGPPLGPCRCARCRPQGPAGFQRLCYLGRDGGDQAVLGGRRAASDLAVPPGPGEEPVLRPPVKRQLAWDARAVACDHLAVTEHGALSCLGGAARGCSRLGAVHGGPASGKRRRARPASCLPFPRPWARFPTAQRRPGRAP